MFWTLQIGAWTAYGISSYLAFLPSVEGSYATMALLKLVRTVLGFGLSLIAWRVLRAVRRRGVGLRPAVAAVLTTSFILGPTWLWLYWTTTAPLRVSENLAVDWSSFPHTALDHTFVMLVWGALYLGACYWRDADDERHRTTQARARAHEAEVGLLRYQLNPHFLFNALSSLRASIPTEAWEARRFVERISSFLRYALDTSEQTRVPLREELDAVEDYLAVEQARWGHDLTSRVEADKEALDVEVPGFLLHPLVENAVKHGMASGARPLAVGVHAAAMDDGSVVVEIANTVTSWEAVESAKETRDRTGPGRHLDSDGVGLENVRRRLQTMFDGKASLTLHREHSQARAVVRLPAAFRAEGAARETAAKPRGER